MNYSIIVPYRNRDEHLHIFVPWIRRHFQHHEIELIVVEQDDALPFNRGALLNAGHMWASGDILISHDVDYLPSPGTIYYGSDVDVYLPVKYAQFCYNTLEPKPLEEVPSGYRHYNTRGTDTDFYGAVVAIKTEAFFYINGYANKLSGWGLDDAILRERIKYYQCSVKRNQVNQFQVLDHPDSGVPIDKLQHNLQQAAQWQANLLTDGVSNFKTMFPDVHTVPPKHPRVDKWLMVKHPAPVAPPLSDRIQCSTLPL